MSKDFNHVAFEEIVERIKDKISHRVNGKVFDYHVAEAIGLDYSYLRVCKVTNAVPFQNVIIFCQNQNISIGWMIFNENVS